MWLWIGIAVARWLFVGIFGPNKVRGKKWRGHRKPSAMLGPDKPDLPDGRRF